MNIKKLNPLQLGQQLIELGLAVQRRQIDMKQVIAVAKPKRLLKLIHSQEDWESDIDPKDRLLGIMEVQGVSQAQLAESMGVTRQYISDLVAGRKPITLKTAKKLAKALKVHSRTIL